MAHAAVDEAIRNVVAVGADPDRVALLDNFSWGDPRRARTLGELVAAVDGCHDAAVAHRAPFVSGKDSLNNEYTGADGRRHAVPPTLVITAVAHVPDAGRCVTPELVEPGDVVVVIGDTRAEFAGSHLDLVAGAPDDDAVGAAPQPDPDAPASVPPAPRRDAGRPRPVLPRRQRGRPRRGARRAVHRRPPRDRRAVAPPP